MLSSRLQAIDIDCESEAKIELDQLWESMAYSANRSSLPSPQAAEAIWLKLISKKEHKFIQEIDSTLRDKPAGQSVNKPSARKPSLQAGEDPAHIEAVIAELLADDRYVGRMMNFYNEAVSKAARQDESSSIEIRQSGFIDATYRAGVTAALRRARRNVLATLDPFKWTAGEEDNSFSAQWKRYSTLSPLRLIWTVMLLSLTSYLIAFIISSDAFRGLLERWGWPGGTGL